MTRRRLRLRPRLFRRYQRSQSGVTAVEFAIVAPPFFMLLFAIFEVAIMLFSEYVIEHGVNQAARMIRTGEVQTQSMEAAEFKLLVCGRLANFLECEDKLHIDVRAFDDFDLVNLPPPITSEGELSPEVTTESEYDPGEPLQAVVVRVYYAWSLFTPGMTHMANLSDGRRLLAAGAAFRNEPYSKS